MNFVRIIIQTYPISNCILAMKKYWFIILMFAVTSCAAESAQKMSLLPSNHDSSKVANKIEEQFLQWKGAPYRYGGTTKKGIDCSAFILMTAKNKFNIKLPRTVAEQVKHGYKISKKEAKPGDLVFFKTGRRTYHVGIYYKDNHFLHVSTKRGVMFSSLDEPYWKSKYWQTRRLM